ncbi:MAG: LPP20 family lipoprotein [Pseudomonadota bacterium]
MRNMFRLLMALTMLISLLIITSCGPSKGDNLDKLTQNAPDWVVKGAGAFETEKGGEALYGVGYASKNPSIAMQRTVSDNRARQELAATLNTYVGRLIKDFMESHQDYLDPAKSNTVEFVSIVSKNVTDATLIGSKVIDHWSDPDNGMYALATLAYDDIVNAIKEKTKEAAEKQAVFLKAKADEALGELNKELDAKK